MPEPLSNTRLNGAHPTIIANYFDEFDAIWATMKKRTNPS